MQKFIHGEVIGFEVKELPKSVKKIEVKDNFYIVGESEIHGNDHRVAVLDKNKVMFYEKDGTLFMRNIVEAEIYCPNADRHDTQIIPPSVWEIRKAQEWDYVEQQARQVAD